MIDMLLKRTGKDGSKYLMYYCPACGYSHEIKYSGEGHPKWDWDGNEKRPTFSPSIRCKGEFHCHHFIRDGKIQYLNDCDHKLKGKTIDMEEA